MVILGDVIEHLPKPLETLRQATSLLRSADEVLSSVLNFGHWYPRVRVATGLFGYDHRGILDETHLRFFTRRSLLRFVFVLRLRPHVESTHVSVYPTERAAAANQA